MKKKVLILSHNYGIQFLESCNQYAYLFDKDRFEVTIAYLSGKPDQTTQHKTKSNRIIFLNVEKKSLRGLKLYALLKVFNLCKTNRFDVVVCHRYKPIYLLLILSKFFVFKKLIYVMDALGTMKSKFRQKIVSLFFKNNMVFAGVSDAVRNDLRSSLQKIPQENIITLYNTIDHHRLIPKLKDKNFLRNKYKVEDNEFLIGSIARLVPVKNLSSLIKAFARTKRNSPPLKLMIIGAGELQKNLEQLAEDLKVENDVIFTGFIEDAYLYMKSFDLFALTSTEEAFGKVLLEAMIASVPIVATKSHGIPEVVSDSGYLVEKNNVEELSLALNFFIHLPLEARHAWGEKGYQHMLNKFTFEVFKKNFWASPTFKFMFEN